ncbi:MAG: CAP domain-containing protein [Gallionella sp.]|nr:CAP domain-containing protein [Gallionella sp.]
MKPVIVAIHCAAALVSISVHAVEIDAAAFVAAHNKWRAKAGIMEKLGYSPALAAAAQAWADNLKRTNHCRMRHSKPDGQYGENLYWASALAWSDGRKELQKVSPEQVVDSWGSEKADYDYTSNQCTPGKMCGHYTQVVWRTTTTVGCAVAVCEDTREQVWACQYQPAGNWIGRKPY